MASLHSSSRFISRLIIFAQFSRISKALRRQAFCWKESLSQKWARWVILQVQRQYEISLMEVSTPLCTTRSKQALLVRSEANPNSILIIIQQTTGQPNSILPFPALPFPSLCEYLSSIPPVWMIIIPSFNQISTMAQQKGEQINQIKLIAVGDSGVGKTSILTRFTYQKFNDYSEPTLGAAFLTKKHTLPTGKSIEFHIWDTAGQQKYRSIAPIYYRQAKIALCVYDITSQRSYEVMKKWVEELQANGPKDIVLAVVGNKIDRCDEEEVDYANVKEYASSLGAILKLVSAKEGKNIDDLFNTVGEMAVKKRGEGPTTTGGQKVTGKKDKKKKSGCC